MLKVISSKLAQTGYLDDQLFGQTYKPWSEIQKIREAKTKEARTDALKLVEEKGHDMKPWSNINSCSCKNCGRDVIIKNITSYVPTCISGMAIVQKCEPNAYPTSNDTWFYGMNAHME